MKPLSTKGQLNTMAPAIIALTVAAVFLILGLVMLQEIRDTDLVSAANNANVNNETVTGITEAGVALAGDASPGCVASIVTAYNSTNITQIIASPNYTVSGCVISTTADADIWNNTDYNITYSYSFGDQAYLGSNSTVEGLATFGDFWEIIVLAIVISIVIGLLLLAFGRRSR